MASVYNQPGGRKVVEIIFGDRRPRIRLGKCDTATARIIGNRIEEIARRVSLGVAMDSASVEWLKTLDATIYKRLAKHGLVPERATVGGTVADAFGAFFDTLEVKASTRKTMEQARDAFETHFGKTRQLATISALDAEKWAKGLKDSHAAATACKRIRVCKRMLASAVRWGMISENPLAAVSAGSMRNPKRLFYVDRPTIEKLLAATADVELRALIALSRFGALRVPGESSALKWGDIDFAAGRLVVTSSKTEKTDGAGSRVVPLFPELRRALQDAFDAAPAGSEYVILRYRGEAKNNRTLLLRLIRKAKLVAWPRLWQNLRASRATELAAEYPRHVAAAWCGHSEAVAQAHYWQAREEDFARAVAETPKTKKAAQKAAHSGTRRTYQDVSQEPGNRPGKALEGQKHESRGEPRDSAMTPWGSEPSKKPPCFVGDSETESESGAFSGARCPESVALAWLAAQGGAR
jgi:integrase